MAEHAAIYLNQQWSVFPVCSPVGDSKRCAEHRPDKHGPDDVGKYPLIRWGPYQDQLPAEAEVRDWWRRWPRANIGLATGHLGDVAVVDLDGAAAAAFADERGYLPGPWATTGRVGGRHLYFAWRENAPTIFAKTNGVDFRGQGGYAVLPPSQHRSGVRYAWGEAPFQGEPLPPLPRWIDELAAEGRGPNGVAGVVLGDILEHQRNETLLSFAGSMRRRGMSQAAIEAALLVENDTRCKPPLDEDEVHKIAASVARYDPSEISGRLLDRVRQPRPAAAFNLGTRARPAVRALAKG